MDFKKILNVFKKKEDKEEESTNHYMSGSEIRAIAKANNKEMRRLEKEKSRKKPESEYITTMTNPEDILEIEDLHSHFFTDQGVVKAVNGVSFNIPINSTVGVVGESGCGKSVTSMSVMRLLQGPSGQIVSGSIKFKALDFKRDEKGNPIPIYEKDENGNVVMEQAYTLKKTKKLDENGNPVLVPAVDKRGEPKLHKDGTPCMVPEYEMTKVLKFDKENNPVMIPKQVRDSNGIGQFEQEEKVFDIAKTPLHEMYRLRGRQMAMIFQEPMTSLNPVFTIGYQLDEVSLLHIPGCTREHAKKRSIEMLEKVGIAMPQRVYASYPHELSGGMRQRVMISMALAGEPRLIIADEPTTALDVTIQAQILELLNNLKTKINGSILLITHDLGVIAEMADYVVVMYAGRIIEQGPVSEIFHHPAHPYTQGLQKSKPTMQSSSDKLFNIPGNVPNPIDMPNYCYFKERCNQCIGKCSGEYPGMIEVSPGHFVACHLYNKKEEN